MAPVFSNGELCPWGVVCKATSWTQTPQGNFFDVYGFARVYFEEIVLPDKKKYGQARWVRMKEFPIDEDDEDNPEFTGLLKFFKNLFTELYTKLIDANQSIPQYSEIPIIRDAKKRLDELDEENLSLAIDAVMNLLVFTARNTDLSQPSLQILEQPVIYNRLGMVTQLLHVL